jgi:hypothetical protein
MKRTSVIVFGLILAVIVQSACGGAGSSSSTGSGSGGSAGSSSVPRFNHVLIVVEENHSYSSVMGNSSMPYLNGLASQYGLATQYYADAHPSLPNYFELTLGEGLSITGLSGDSYTDVVTQDNVVRALTAAGKTWKSYQEALPAVAYLGGDSGAYLQHHNPFVYFSDVQNSPTQAGNIVSSTQLDADIANSTLPDYAFIVPDVNDDAHNCPAGMSTCSDDQKLAAADQWLSAHIGPLVAGAAFQNSLLIIVFDEGDFSDIAYGGGQVATVIASPLAKPGYQSRTFYQHDSTLRLMLEGLGVTDLPGGAATAPDMGEFFK